MMSATGQTVSALEVRPPLWRRVLQFLRRLGPAGPLAAAATCMPGIGTLLLYHRLGPVAAWLREHGEVGPVVCAAAFGLLGGCALLPTYALSLVCGWSFGFGAGLVTTLTGFVAAALAGYALARVMDRGRVMGVVNESPKFRSVHGALVRGSAVKVIGTVALVRLAPVAPFSLTNLAMAAIGVHPLPYAVGTLLGMAPRTALIVYAASRLSSIDASPEDDPLLYAAGIAATLVATVTLGWMAKKALKRATADAPVTA